jgi:ribonuclease BN (tRNA processing enzyme)
VKFTLVPSSVADSGLGHVQYVSSCVINDCIALDAGCIGFYYTPQDQVRIRHVLLSHTHIDHMASLPIFVENVFEGKADCVTIHGSSSVLDSCQRDLFNNRLWPDFIGMSVNNERPFVKMSLFEAGQTIELEGLRITAVALNHVVPTVGYLISEPGCTVAFVSDTGPTDEIWRHINAAPHLKGLFLETAFPNSLTWLADVSKHLTPAMMAEELTKLTRPIRTILVHLKPRYRNQIVAEIEALKKPTLEISQFGVPYLF